MITHVGFITVYVVLVVSMIWSDETTNQTLGRVFLSFMVVHVGYGVVRFINSYMRMVK